MANRSYLIAGSQEALSRWGMDDQPAESEFKTLAALAYGVPFLWLGMFSSDTLEHTPSSDEVEWAGRVILQSSTDDAARRIIELGPYLAKYFSGQMPLQPLIQTLADYVRSGGSHVLLDLTEIAMMDDPDEYADQVKECTDWFSRLLTNRSAPAPAPRSLVSRLFGGAVSAPEIPDFVEQFAGGQCRLNRIRSLPSIEELRDRKRCGKYAEITCALLGASWDEPAPWEPA